MIVKVLTVEGQPEFCVSDTLGADEVDRIVRGRYGGQQNGSSHNWRGCKEGVVEGGTRTDGGTKPVLAGAPRRLCNRSSDVG